MQGASLINEGGYPSGRPSATPASSEYMGSTLPVDVKRRNRWRQDLPPGTSSPPCGVDPAVASPSGSASSTSQREQASPKAAIEPVRPAQPPVKPLAVKSKAAKPGLGSPKAPEHLPSIPEQDLLRALYAHQQTQTGGAGGLLDLAPARPATGAADPQMPESTIWNSGDGSNANTDAATTEIHIQEDVEPCPTL